MSKIVELYGLSTDVDAAWPAVIAGQQCPFLRRKCLKNRKSAPEITIGSCTVAVGKQAAPVMICPFRLLERNQIFMDCIHLLTLHEPGNEIQTFAHVSKHLVLVHQDCLTAYMKKEFSFDHLHSARLGDPMHLHAYSLEKNNEGALRLQLAERLSTDRAGIAQCLGRQAKANVELEDILRKLGKKISTQTLMRIEQPPPGASLIDQAAANEG